MTANQRRLERLLNVAHKDYDDGAVQALLERDPSATRGVDEILFLALRRQASAATIGLICNACPESAQEKNSTGDAPLHAAIDAFATVDVVRLLHELWPQSIEMVDSNSDTPLHIACYSGNATLEVVKFLAKEHPGALAMKNEYGGTPLAMSCEHRWSCDDLLIFLIEKHPAAIKVRDSEEEFPLHRACYYGASKKVVALLADKYPEALWGKDRYHHTPLHHTIFSGRTNMIDIVKLLVERYPDAVGELNVYDWTPLQTARERRAPPEVIRLLSTLQSFLQNSDEDGVRRTLERFHDMEWPGGVALVLNKFPAIANKMDQRLMPRVLSLVGRRCTLNTFYSMFLDNPALAKGAVKRSTPVGKPQAKKARK